MGGGVRLKRCDRSVYVKVCVCVLKVCVCEEVCVSVCSCLRVLLFDA